MNGIPAGRRKGTIISVGSSSRKAGKSALASHLVRELGAEFGLKVSSGIHSPAGPLTSDPRVISLPGTDTGKLVEAGARQVLWVHADPDLLPANLSRALSMFPEEGLLVIEGNSATVCLDPDYVVFLMGVPFDEFKPSAMPALERADLVLLDRSGPLGRFDRDFLENEISRLSPAARIISYQDGAGREAALSETARLIRESLDL